MLDFKIVVTGFVLIMVLQVVTFASYERKSYPELFTITTKQYNTMEEVKPFEVHERNDLNVISYSDIDPRSLTFGPTEDKVKHENKRDTIQERYNSAWKQIEYYPPNKIPPVALSKETIESFYKNLIAKINQTTIYWKSSGSNFIRLPRLKSPEEQNPNLSYNDKLNENVNTVRVEDNVLKINDLNVMVHNKDTADRNAMTLEEAIEKMRNEMTQHKQSKHREIEVNKENLITSIEKGDGLTFYGNSRRSANSRITEKPNYVLNFDWD